MSFSGIPYRDDSEFVKYEPNCGDCTFGTLCTMYNSKNYGNICSSFRRKHLEKIKEPCSFCLNAYFDDELNDDNDFSSFTIGGGLSDNRIMLSVGDGKPLRITSESYDYEYRGWIVNSIYYPKFCPECGRQIIEYKKVEKESGDIEECAKK